MSGTGVSRLATMVQRGTPVPPSRQLAALYRDKIASGELAKDAQLPSVTALSQEHDISVVTVQKAMKILKKEELIYTVPGYGTFVR